MLPYLYGARSNTSADLYQITTRNIRYKTRSLHAVDKLMRQAVVVRRILEVAYTRGWAANCINPRNRRPRRGFATVGRSYRDGVPGSGLPFASSTWMPIMFLSAFGSK